MKNQMVFNKDHEAYFNCPIKGKEFYETLNEEVFGRKEATAMNCECYSDGSTVNSSKIEKVIKHVTGMNVKVYDYIDDNGYLKYINVDFPDKDFPNLKIEISTDCHEYYIEALDNALYSEEVGMNFMYEPVLEMIYWTLSDDADPDGEDKIEELLKEERVTIVYDCCTLFESVAI